MSQSPLTLSLHVLYSGYARGFKEEEYLAMLSLMQRPRYVHSVDQLILSVLIIVNLVSRLRFQFRVERELFSRVTITDAKEAVTCGRIQMESSNLILNRNSGVSRETGFR